MFINGQILKSKETDALKNAGCLDWAEFYGTWHKVACFSLAMWGVVTRTACLAVSCSFSRVGGWVGGGVE